MPIVLSFSSRLSPSTECLFGYCFLVLPFPFGSPLYLLFCWHFLLLCWDYVFFFVSCMFLIIHWSTLNTAALKSLSDYSNVSFISVLASIHCLFPFSLRFFWLLVWKVIFNWNCFYLFCCGFPRWHGGKESTCQCRRGGFSPRVGKVPWRKKWQLTPVLLPGQSRGQRRLADYSRWGHKEWDTIEWLSTHTHLFFCTSLLGEGEALLHHCKIEVDIQVLHLFSLDSWPRGSCSGWRWEFQFSMWSPLTLQLEWPCYQGQGHWLARSRSTGHWWESWLSSRPLLTEPERGVRNRALRYHFMGCKFELPVSSPLNSGLGGSR